MLQNIAKGVLCIAVGAAAGYAGYKSYKALSEYVKARRETDKLLQETSDLIDEVQAETDKLRNKDIEETQRWQKRSNEVREHLATIEAETAQRAIELATLKKQLDDGVIDTVEYAQRLLALTAV